MKYSDDILAQYLSGDCSEELQREIDADIERDTSVRDAVEALRKQDVEIKAAFDHLLDLPLPAAATTEVAAASKTTPADTPDASAFWSRAVAALILLGVGAIVGSLLQGEPALNESNAQRPWYVPVAEYQALYGRPTLSQPNATDEQVAATERKLTDLSGLPVSIPDLSDWGLAFKRGQYLEAGDTPLIQLAYLPKSGEPVALCFMRQSGVDTATTPAQHAGLNLRHWRTNNVGWVLVGDLDDTTLNAISTHIRAH